VQGTSETVGRLSESIGKFRPCRHNTVLRAKEFGGKKRREKVSASPAHTALTNAGRESKKKGRGEGEGEE